MEHEAEIDVGRLGFSVLACDGDLYQTGSRTIKVTYEGLVFGQLGHSQGVIRCIYQNFFYTGCSAKSFWRSARS